MKIPRSLSFCSNVGTPALPARAAIMLVAVLSLASTRTLAGVDVSGSTEAVTVEAQNAPIDEVLTALSHAFNVQYHGPIDLRYRITGTYRGSLRRVLTRILEGYNYIVKSSPDRVEVTVLEPEHAPAAGEGAVATMSGTIPQSKPQPTPTSSQVIQQPEVATPPSIATVPGMKLAEAPAPVPTVVPSDISLPGPIPDAKSVALPAPIASGSAELIPKPQPSAVAPPMPQLPSSGPGNSPLPSPHESGSI
jgi:hypothetical protein